MTKPSRAVGLLGALKQSRKSSDIARGAVDIATLIVGVWETMVLRRKRSSFSCAGGRRLSGIRWLGWQQCFDNDQSLAEIESR